MSAESRNRSGSALPEARTPTHDGVVRVGLRILLLFGALLAAFWILRRVQGVLMLLALSVLFAYLVAPIVTFFSRPIPALKGRALSLPVAIFAAYLVIFGVVVGTSVLVWPVVNAQLSEMRSEAPAYVTRVQNSWQTWKAGQTRMLPRNVRGTVNDLVDDAASSAERYVRDDLLPRLGGWLMGLPWLILVPIFSFFLLKDAERFREYALEMVQRRRLRWRVDVFFEDVSRTLAAYIRAQLFACLVVAVVCSAGFLALGVPYPVLFGVGAGLFEALPLAGPLAVAVLVVAVTALHSTTGAVEVAGFLLVARIVQDYVIYPRLVGRELPLHPMAVILAILCGGEIGGVAGIFLAVPVLAILTMAYRHWRAHQAAEVPRPALA
jgi:predicted PurR-regulated permease PerM